MAEQTDTTPASPSSPTSISASSSSSLSPLDNFLFPIKFGGSNAVNPQMVENLFQHTEKQHEGGYFPVGANKLWHGGLHIHTARRSPIFAIADGQIVAVRLAESDDKAIGHYGSRNFILIKHAITGKMLNAQFSRCETSASASTSPSATSGGSDTATESSFSNEDVKYFYSLYMHLHNEALNPENNHKLNDFKWLPKTSRTISTDTITLASGKTLEALARTWHTTVSAIREANAALEDLGHYGTNGSTSWYHVNDAVNRPPYEINEIDTDFLTSLGAGEVTKVENTFVKAGDLLWSSGVFGLDRPMSLVHWEIFSEENLLPSFVSVIDDDDNYNMDIDAIFKMVDINDDDEGHENLSVEEVINFYKSNANSVTLRSYSCKFIFEWAMNIDHTIENMLEGVVTAGLKEKLESYVWWDNAVTKGIDLPGSKLLWHYNPISFINTLNKPATKYGCHNLQRGDRDREGSTLPRWGGVNNPPAAINGCTTSSNTPTHVRELQEDLRSLGFGLIGTPDGSFGLHTQWAVREFQIYAKMSHVARIRSSASDEAKQGAHIVAQLGQQAGTSPPISVYINSLEQVENNYRYEGHISGIVNTETRHIIKHWLDNNWRCPVIVEGWTMHSGSRHQLYQHNGQWAVNVWGHKQIPSNTPYFFVRDFSGYYTFPTDHSENDMVIIGKYVSYLTYGGPLSKPPRHTWQNSEVLPTVFNLNSSNNAHVSTFCVVRSVAEIECLGHFDSLNAYDNAFISQGLCHWTLGIIYGSGVSEGELCGFFAYMIQAETEAFEQALGFFGVTPDKIWGEWGNGASGLWKKSQAKYAGWINLQQEDGTYRSMPKTTAEGDYFRMWHWYYRLTMAGRTIEGYRRLMWPMARMRLRDIRAVSWGTHTGWNNLSSATIGDVVTSEKGTAILLRWHVLYPGGVVSNAHSGGNLRSALTHARDNNTHLTWSGSPIGWTHQHEAAIVAGLLHVAATHSVEGIRTTIPRAAGYPEWTPPPNVNSLQFTLWAPYTNTLSEQRNSFVFDDSGLPEPPTTTT